MLLVFIASISYHVDFETIYELEPSSSIHGKGYFKPKTSYNDVKAQIPFLYIAYKY